MIQPNAAPTRVTSQVALVTPELARDLLSRNRRNRPLSQTLVKRYADAMRRGEWQLNGDSVRLDEDGNLLDAQHRLTAIVASGASIPMLIIRGLSASAAITIDVGKRRSMSDIFSMTRSGIPHSAGAAAAIRLMYHIDIGRLGHNAHPSETQLLAALDAHPTLPTFTSFGTRLSREILVNGTSATVFAYLVSDYCESDDFFARLLSGVGLEEGDPRITLRRLLSNKYRSAVKQGDTRQRVDFLALVRTWNAYLSNRPLRMLAVRSTDDDTPISRGTPR